MMRITFPNFSICRGQASVQLIYHLICLNPQCKVTNLFWKNITVESTIKQFNIVVSLGPDALSHARNFLLELEIPEYGGEFWVFEQDAMVSVEEVHNRHCGETVEVVVKNAAHVVAYYPIVRHIGF